MSLQSHKQMQPHSIPQLNTRAALFMPVQSLRGLPLEGCTSAAPGFGVGRNRLCERLSVLQIPCSLSNEHTATADALS